MTHLTPQQWREVDKQIFACYRIYAIDLIQRFSGAELSEACRLYENQTQKLRAEAPERFEMTQEERTVAAFDFVAARVTA